MANNRVTIYNSKLYYGANSSVYTTEGTISVGYAGVWDGTSGASGWTTLDGGIQTGWGRGMYVVNENHIYCYGNFSSIGSAQNLSYGTNFNIAKWNGTQWEALGTLGATNNEIGDVCYDEENNILYVVGKFTQVYGISANYVARFDGTNWSALNNGGNSYVYSCTLDGDKNLYVCGTFGGMTNSSFVNYTMGIARFNYASQLWESIGTGNIRTTWDAVYSASNNSVYFCGSFAHTNSVTDTKLLARYSITDNQWYSLGAFNGANDSTIYDIAIVNGNEIYAGGYFESNGNDVAYYDGSTWTGMGLNDGYTLVPTQSYFGPIDICVDGNRNIYINRNAGGFYILKNGETTWKRLDNLDVDVTITDPANGGSSQPANNESSMDTSGFSYFHTSTNTLQSRKVKNTFWQL